MSCSCQSGPLSLNIVQPSIGLGVLPYFTSVCSRALGLARDSQIQSAIVDRHIQKATCSIQIHLVSGPGLDGGLVDWPTRPVFVEFTLPGWWQPMPWWCTRSCKTKCTLLKRPHIDQLHLNTIYLRLPPYPFYIHSIGYELWRVTLQGVHRGVMTDDMGLEMCMTWRDNMFNKCGLLKQLPADWSPWFFTFHKSSQF